MWIEGEMMSAIIVALAAMVGLVLSVVLESLMTPRPSFSRPAAAWALHGGIWLLVYGVFLLLLGRPWFSMAIVSAMLLTLILVNNAKMHSLREPFVFQDYEYFTDAIKYPRLYIPFLGWGKFTAAAVGFLGAVAVGFLGETAPVDRFLLDGQLGAVIMLLAFGALAMLAGKSGRLVLTLVPEQDLCRLGFLAYFWRYGEEERKFPVIRSPFDSDAGALGSTQPHLVAIQSESFFDARTLYSGIRTDVLSEYDALKDDAKATGKMKVPAWGANTVRTEFSFLSGIASEKLGVHRFNPYRAVAAGWDVASIASLLKKRGYRTVAIHPYPVSFYQRSQVYPRIGFDEFIDVEAFSEADRSGPYTGDMAVANKVREVLESATQPIFIFVITMENHGPLHLETVKPADIEKLYTSPPPAGCDDLTVYLRHLGNANRMIKSLREMLEALPVEAELCWYSDHVPIMPTVYKIFGVPNGEVEYVIWSNRKQGVQLRDVLDVGDLASHWTALGKPNAVQEIVEFKAENAQTMDLKQEGINNNVSIGDGVHVYGRIRGNHNTVIFSGSKYPSTIHIDINGDNNTVRCGHFLGVKKLRIGCGSHVAANNTRLIIGENFSSAVDNRFLLYTSGFSLKIGDDCLFSNNITIRCGESPHLIFDLETGENLDQSDGVVIGDHVWVGERAYLIKGAGVPDECIVGACSVVTRKFTLPHAVIAGNPAKVVRESVQWIRNHAMLEEGSKYKQAYDDYHGQFK